MDKITHTRDFIISGNVYELGRENCIKKCVNIYLEALILYRILEGINGMVYGFPYIPHNILILEIIYTI